MRSTPEPGVIRPFPAPTETSQTALAWPHVAAVDGISIVTATTLAVQTVGCRSIVEFTPETKEETWRSLS